MSTVEFQTLRAGEWFDSDGKTFVKSDFKEGPLVLVVQLSPIAGKYSFFQPDKQVTRVYPLIS